MNKAVTILIALIYIASIVLISLFGMKAIVAVENVPVTSIECINVTDEKARVSIDQNTGNKVIQVSYVGAYNQETQTGTMIEIKWKVSPDNAVNKNIKITYDTNKTGIIVGVDENGYANGYIYFTQRLAVDIKISSTDGTRITETVHLLVW